uniref:U3 small nucleolar RNA-associated protein n=1 Tax=Ananas comosus var. bracteatus TaxID=296719 RepID=A0A6V7PRV9_ANACO|nr:unnamed protein product [Ananas comosus var. bracteatus]
MAAEKKRKSNKKKNPSGEGGDRKKKRHGPRLPAALLKELAVQNPSPSRSSDEEDDDDYAGGDRGEDVYEYDEPVPEEEARKNRRFDEVENYEYELPEDFEDEDVPSDEGEEDEEITSNRSDDDGEEGEKHLRMLQEVTGMPAEAFDDKKKKKKVTLSDFQGDNGDQRISIHDLLDSIRGKTGYSELRKRVEQQESKPMAVQVPLPKVEREKLERKFAYEHAKKDITKWEPLVKRNREAPTLLFEQDVDLGFSTVGAIASQFEPRTEFERKMAKLVRDPEMVEAYNKDGARLLELNEVSVEDVKERQNRLAKMRSLLFRHEMKAKHIKKIKSKTYHRILKKEKLKAASAELQVDPEVAKEYAMKQEFKRAERGLNVQDEGTRAAIAEQLHQHALLTRKMNSMKDDTSSSDESTDNEDLDEELSPGKDDERVSKLLNRAKDKTVKVLEEEDEIPKSGVLALPFMERGLKKRQEAAYEEARLALQEYDASLRQFEDGDVEESQRSLKIKGKRAFGPKNQPQESNKRTKLDDVERSSDSEDEYEAAEQARVGSEVNNKSDEVHLGTALLDDEPETAQGAVFKMKSKGVSGNNTESTAAKDPPKPNNDMKEMDENDDSDSEEEMVEGFLSTSDGKANYELPSQAVLIHQAFAGDDVEAEFEKDKMEALNEEVPEPEKPEHENAERKREEALKKRKDAKLKHVIISENIDKKAEKLLATTLPFPYKSKEVYEQSIRMPIGPEFNPAISVQALNRPAIVKKAGVIIKPIQYEEVDPHEKPDEPKRIIQKAEPNRKGKKSKKSKPAGGKKPQKPSAEKRIR